MGCLCSRAREVVPECFEAVPLVCAESTAWDARSGEGGGVVAICALAAAALDGRYDEAIAVIALLLVAVAAAAAAAAATAAAAAAAAAAI